MMKTKKNWIIILLLICVFLPMHLVYATDSDSVGDGKGGTKKGICHGSECKGTMHNVPGGVRFTFIDAHGNALSDSYDFVTYSVTTTHIYNAYSGNKSKLGGQFSEGETKISDLPKLSSLISVYNQYAHNKSSLPTSGNTGANYKSNYKKELNWFLSITARENAEYAYTNVMGLIAGIKAAYPSFDAERVTLSIEAACQSEEEVFIIMEPLIGYLVGAGGAGSHKFFGTLRDWALYYDTIPYQFNYDKEYIIYDHNILAPNFDAFDPHNPGFTAQSVDDVLNSRDGFGVALDWVSDPATACNKCTYDTRTGQLKYDDRLISQAELPRALAKVEEGGYGCCSILEIFENSINPNTPLYQLYNEMCDKPDNDKKCKKEANKYYCKNGEECTESEYKNQCGCHKEGSKYYCQDNKECSQEEYKQQCENCCNESVPETKIDINNCCIDNTHSYVKEPKLDELFCENTDLKVANAWPKCDANADYREETNNLNQYCTMYCSESLSVDLPSSIAAKSGRYFTLTQTVDEKGNPLTLPDGTPVKSPYILGSKSCRIVTDYKKWYTDYEKEVKALVTAYNNYQQKAAEYDAYNSATKTTGTASAKYTCTASCDAVLNPSNKCSDIKKQTLCEKSSGSCEWKDNSCVAKTTSISTTETNECTVNYDKYTNLQEKSYTGTKADIKKSATSIIGDSDASGKTSLFGSKKEYYDTDTSSCSAPQAAGESKTVSKDGHSCTTTWSCSLSINGISSDNTKDISDLMSKAKTAADTAKTTFQSQYDKVKALEEQMNKCQKFFTDYEGKDPANFYKLDPEIEFYYTQMYLTADGSVDSDKQQIDWETGDACVYEGPTTEASKDADGDISDRKYSASYGSNKKYTSTVFKRDITYTPLAYTGNLAGPVNLDASITNDGKYTAKCAWKEADTTYATLYPSGLTASTATRNFTLHNREYQVSLTTLSGKYDTVWNITGLGSDGKYDSLFSEGETCSNDISDGNMSCTLEVTNELITTGNCNPPTCSTTPTSSVDGCACLDIRTDIRNFSFRIVDEANLFPSGTTVTENGNQVDIAYNWVSTDEGKAALQEIQEIAERGETFNRKYLTYSFKLTQTDMSHIKNYNSMQIPFGGYADFELDCECDGNTCTKCKSKFIEQLANGNVRYDNADHRVSGWANTASTLQNVRDSNKNW